MLGKIAFIVFAFVFMRFGIQQSRSCHWLRKWFIRISFFTLIAIVTVLIWDDDVLKGFFITLYLLGCLYIVIYSIVYVIRKVLAFFGAIRQNKSFGVEMKLDLEEPNAFRGTWFWILSKIGLDEYRVRYENNKKLSLVTLNIEYYLKDAIKIEQATMDRDFIRLQYQNIKGIEREKIEKKLRKVFKGKIEEVFVHEDKILLQFYQ